MNKNTIQHSLVLAVTGIVVSSAAGLVNVAAASLTVCDTGWVSTPGIVACGNAGYVRNDYDNSLPSTYVGMGQSANKINNMEVYCVAEFSTGDRLETGAGAGTRYASQTLSRTPSSMRMYCATYDGLLPGTIVNPGDGDGTPGPD